MVVSEANPLCKSGGLADVSYSLSRELNKSSHKTIIVLPFYKSVKKKQKYNYQYLGYYYVDMSWRHQYVGVFKCLIDGIDYYLIDNEYYFNRDGLYGYDDDNERFAYFSIAAIELLKYISFQADIVHIHDWQGGMIPCLLKEKYCFDSFFKDTRTVLTIHNPAFKGIMDKYFLANYYNLNDDLFYNGKVRFENMVSTLKSAIVYADKITTVSPTHRNELLDSRFSQGLDCILRLREDDFVGIVNGLDVDEFNPLTDKTLKAQFSKNNCSSKKKIDKKDLFECFHLPFNDGPAFGLVSRLTFQKGINLIFDNIEHLINNGANLFILGSGEKELENTFQMFRDRFPDKIGLYIGYNDMLAHKIYGGSDFFLMPSLFEPCGIGQLIAQRYATLPIVRSTGGLVDTVTSYDGANLNEATGIRFDDYSGYALGEAINKALAIYQDKEVFSKIRTNSLNLDLGWDKSMDEYINIYKEAIKK